LKTIGREYPEYAGNSYISSYINISDESEFLLSLATVSIHRARAHGFVRYTISLLNFSSILTIHNQLLPSYGLSYAHMGLLFQETGIAYGIKHIKDLINKTVH